MKRTNFLGYILIGFLAFGLLSCGDDESSNTPDFESVPEGQMAMTYNGEDWESTTVTGINSTAISTITAEGNLNLVFMVLQSTDPGTYELGGSSLNSLTVRNLVAAEDYSTSNEANASGEIVIEVRDEDARTISGSFNGIVIDDSGDSRNVANGLFNKMPYSQ